MRPALFFIILIIPLLAFVFKFEAQAAPAGPLIKHLASLVKWSRSSKAPHQSDGNVVQLEDGYLVETVVEGNELGVVPYSIRVSQEGELFAVDADNSNIVRVTPPISQYSRARLVAGSFEGQKGHVDGKPTEARFNHPKGVTMDDKGNVYVADTSNLAIRKIGEAGVTTIAGGKSNVAGYRDGPGEDAKFSADFDIIYVRPTCSLLVIDRGNAALRQISLSKEDCDYENSSVSPTDLIMVAGAILIGYASQGFRTSFFSKKQGNSAAKVDEKSIETETEAEMPTSLDTTSMNLDEEEVAWPSIGQLIWNIATVAFEALIPSKDGLTPLKDSCLIMLQDHEAGPLKQRSRTPTPLSETRHAKSNDERFSEGKLPKVRSTSTSLSSRHRSSRPSVMEPKPAETKYDPYNFRTRYGDLD